MSHKYNERWFSEEYKGMIRERLTNPRKIPNKPFIRKSKQILKTKTENSTHPKRSQKNLNVKKKL